MTPAQKDPEDVKNAWLKIRVTEDRLQDWKEAAARAKDFEDADDLDFSAWVRRALAKAARDEARRQEEARQQKRGKAR